MKEKWADISVKIHEQDEGNEANCNCKGKIKAKFIEEVSRGLHSLHFPMRENVLLGRRGRCLHLESLFLTYLKFINAKISSLIILKLK